jgi:hypothetical protein
MKYNQNLKKSQKSLEPTSQHCCCAQCTIGWVDIGTRIKVPLRFVTYLSKIMKIIENSVLTQ